MVITKELLKEKYDEYNKLYFDGKLGKCVFSLLPENTSYLGMFTVKSDRNGERFGWIRLGKCILWNEEIFKNTLIHEMIHMYNHLVEGGLADTWPFNGLFWHGFFFKRQCWRIKRKYGLKINANIRIRNNFIYVRKELTPSLIDRIFSRILGC